MIAIYDEDQCSGSGGSGGAPAQLMKLSSDEDHDDKEVGRGCYRRWGVR